MSDHCPLVLKVDVTNWDLKLLQICLTSESKRVCVLAYVSNWFLLWVIEKRGGGDT